MMNSSQSSTVVVQNSGEEQGELLTYVDLAPVEPGQEILVAATRLSEDKHSVIKLVTKSPNLAFNFAILKDAIVRNHREGEMFDESKEERDENLCDPNYKQPIKSENPFLVTIFMGEEEFHVAIDEKRFCTFKYRVPLSEITRIELENLVNITQVDQRSLYPKKWPPAPYMSSDIVFSNDLPRQFQQSHIAIIAGEVSTNTRSQEGNFDIHFQARNTSRELLLMRISFEKGTVDLKAMDETGKYVNEETIPYPFMANDIFRIGISWLESQFKIAIDGEELCTYMYVDKDIHEKMTGFKIKTTKGLKFNLHYVEHKFVSTEVDDLLALTELPPMLEGRREDKFNEQFFAGLACPLRISHTIIAGGTADKASTRPIIQLETKDAGTIALALVVDFQGKMISRNTQKDCEWGTEETTENLCDPKSPNPIIPGKEFKICFLCCRDKFFISINDRPYCTYEYRLRLEYITRVRIRYMRKVHRLDHQTALPSPWPLHREFIAGNDFSNDIPIKFTPGHVIVIGGVPTGKGWIIINFYDQFVERNLMHFNVRFDQHIVVRAWRNKDCDFKGWDASGGLPFRLNRRFRMAVGFKKDRFIFAVNGKYFCEYPYHDPVFDIGVGFKLFGQRGLTIKIHEIEHCHLNPECDGIEGLSLFCQYCPEKPICPPINKP